MSSAWGLLARLRQRSPAFRALGRGGGEQPPNGAGVLERRLGHPRLGLSIRYEREMSLNRAHRFEQAISDFVGEHHIAWLLRELEVDLVLDVGANRGQYARRLRREGYQGRIVSFEPLPSLVAELREASADDPDWVVHDCALGDEDGSREIYMRRGAMSSLLPSSEFGRDWSDKLQESTAQTIRIRRLQDLWPELVADLDDPKVYLKLDTQGYDLEAFRGAGPYVAELRGLQSELAMVPIYDGMPRFAEQLTTYEAAGFETTGLFPVSRDRPTMRVIEFDVVMIGPAALAERG